MFSHFFIDRPIFAAAIAFLIVIARKADASVARPVAKATVVFAQNRVVLVIELDVGPGVLPDQHPVAGLDRHR